jgi:hypothetical protein
VVISGISIPAAEPAAGGQRLRVMNWSHLKTPAIVPNVVAHLSVGRATVVWFN